MAANFRLYEQMINGVDNWAKCDCLSMRLFGPAFLEQPALAAKTKKWAASKNIWKCRSAAASLVLPARKGKNLAEILAVTRALAPHPDIMVQKGLGWLLRELGKYSPETALPLVIRIKSQTSR